MCIIAFQNAGKKCHISCALVGEYIGNQDFDNLILITYCSCKIWAQDRFIKKFFAKTQYWHQKT
jgi:hypothetical protein